MKDKTKIYVRDRLKLCVGPRVIAEPFLNIQLVNSSACITRAEALQ